MDDLGTHEDGPAGPARPVRIMVVAVTLALLAATAIYQGYHAYLAFDPNDMYHLETTAILITAKQLADGPSTLYGPFSGDAPLVLIHAPLYYRLAALGAWPLARCGLDPMAAAIVSGRLLSLLGLIVTCLAAARVARVDGASAVAGLWAALLIASSPIYGSYGFTVKPDSLGIASQTAGFALALTALRRGREASILLVVAAGVAFALAACTKQHLIVAGGVAATLLLVSAARGKVRWSAALIGLVAGAIVTAAYYGCEEWVTGGMMSRSVFRVSSRLRETAYAGWPQVLAVFLESAKLASGEIALAVALLIAGIRATRPTWLDSILGLAFAAEVAAMVPLCLNSDGSWVNYALPATVWGSILLARGSAAILQGAKPIRLRTLAIPLAAIAVLLADLRYTAITAIMQRDEAHMLGQVLSDPIVAGTPRDQRYFVGMPQGNRLHGRKSLAYDDWLYRQYEAMGIIEPRAQWLLRVLATDSVRVLIIGSKSSGLNDHPEGLPVEPPELGFHLYQQYGKYAVWVRGPNDNSRPTLQCDLYMNVNEFRGTPITLLHEQGSLPSGGQRDMIEGPIPTSRRPKPDLPFSRDANAPWTSTFPPRPMIPSSDRIGRACSRARSTTSRKPTCASSPTRSSHALM